MSHDDYNHQTGGWCGDAPESPEFDLFNLPPLPPPRPEITDADWIALTPAERFERFHKRNPSVYREIVKRCREWKAAGNGKLGMSLLFGIVRWQLALSTQGDPFKINDHYLPFYSRLVMWLEPDLDGLFDVRRSPEADAWLAELKAKAA